MTVIIRPFQCVPPARQDVEIVERKGLGHPDTPRGTGVPGRVDCHQAPVAASYRRRKTRGFDFSVADRVPAALYNRVLWEGLMPGKPYPAELAGQSVVRTAVADRDD